MVPSLLQRPAFDLERKKPEFFAVLEYVNAQVSEVLSLPEMKISNDPPVDRKGGYQ